MASSPSTPYSSLTSKTYQNPHQGSHNHLPKNNQQHRNPRRIQPSPASSTAAAAGNRSISPSISSTCHKDVILDPKPPFLPYYPQASKGALTPEFRRSRTTRVISKRNFTSPRTSHGNHRMASPAAVECLTRILQSSPGADGWAINSVLLEFRASLVGAEDYCYILNEVADNDKSPSRALRFFHLAMPLMRGPTQQGKLLTAAIGGFGRIFCPDLARQVFDVGVKVGYANTVFAYSALISAYARSGLAAEAMETLEAMKVNGLKPTTITYNAVIDACGKGGVSIQFTLGFFREMLHKGLCPDRKTFNSLLAACSRAGHLEDALVMFDEMIRLGIGRDIYTYNTFIDAICKCGNMELAVQVMSDMPANNVQPNVVTYSTLMDGYSKLEQYDEALKVYEEMKALGIQLDRVCYNTLLVIFVKTGKYEEIIKVCEEMDVMRVEKDTVTYNSLINGYGKQGRFEMVSYLIQEMREKGVPPSVLTYSTLIDIYSKAGMYVDAANMFMEFKKSGLKADVVLYSSFIDTLAKNGLVDCAVWLLDEMTRMGIEPNVVTYNTIIDAFGKSRTSVDDTGLGNEITGLQGSSSQIIRAFGQLARGVGRPVVDEASRRSEELLCILGLFQKMVQQGVKPNVVTFSAILNACSRCDSFEDASILLEQLRLFDNFVYGVAHGLLMGQREVWAQAQSLFDELRRMDPSTSSAFYNALTDMLWHFGQRRGAQQVVLEGVQRQVWENTWSEFTLDLHLMSVGAAQAMVHAWLLTIRSIVFQGHEVPEFVSILTGWGKHSKVAGTGTLRHVTELLLDSVGAPFQLEKFNVGRFVSRGTMLAAWLRKAGTINILLLRDERAQPANPMNLLPRLQALQL